MANCSALNYFKRLVHSQGGDAEAIEHIERLPTAPYTIDIVAEKSGYITNIVANELGRAAMLLGAGRRKKDDYIDHAVGLYVHKKVGDYVELGDVLCTIHSQVERPITVATLVKQHIIISEQQRTEPLIYDVVR